MSLFTQPYAVPSRVKGAVQLVAQERGHKIKREAAEALLSPASLKGDDTETEKMTMVRRTIDECVRLRLFLVDGDILVLNHDLPKGLRAVDTIPETLPQAILDLMVDENNTGNDDLLAPLAWFMGQELANPPANWAEFARTLEGQGVIDLFKFNDTRYANFSYWSRYLGLATLIGTVSVSRAIDERLFPDPTDALRRLLKKVFAGGPQRRKAGECLQQIGALCPLFEGGRIRRAMESHSPKREPRHLSPSTSLALLRLEDEGTIKMHTLSDAEALILVDGQDRRPFSEVSWIHSLNRPT